MPSWTERTELILGKDGLERLKKSSVLIVGLGGVGGIAAEMICRAGVGEITLIDRDTVSNSNINRQIIALQSTLGKNKSEVLAQRLQDINPEVDLHVITDWLDENNMLQVLSERKFDYVVDAIDTLSPKVYLLKICVENGIKVVSSMGAGAKTDPTKVKIDDISKTIYCPLAKAVRKRLQKMGIKEGIKAVYSTEEADQRSVIETDEKYKKSTTGTISYMPNLFGLMLASVVVREIAAGEFSEKTN
jgi:tRNA A37 threonylcarbamoyladenosine dehydratase